MANEEHLAILMKGVEVWNAWRKMNREEPDLQGANLQEAILPKANLQGANLQGANLRRATLQGADLREINLSEANLQWAYFQDADFQEANLEKASLQWANLRKANLRKANLREANLYHVILQWTILHETNLHGANLLEAQANETHFADIDLSTVEGLETIKHLGPSFISTDTLYKSKGKIAESFLRGCGVPDSMIEYLPSLIGAMEAIQYYSCFISHCSKDKAFARRLHERMRAEHLRVWFAPEALKGGEKLFEQIDSAIRVYDKVLVVLSEESIRNEWVITEIRRARKQELRTQRRKLFPIRLCAYKILEEWEYFDTDTKKDLAVEIREYFIPDFSNWKEHDAFEASFARLLQDLRAAETPLPRKQ